MQEARTGSEARGGSTPDGPFKQTYTYDVWENTTARSYRIWSGSLQSDSTTFTNNKRQYWFYDAEGNLGGDSDANYGYDAAGRQNHFSANVYVGGWPTPHLSGKNRYTDLELLSTVVAMKGIRAPDYSGMSPNARTLAASYSWSESMQLACKPRKK